MPLTPGARLGSYEIVTPLGAGGMGEVYRARDTRLNRDIAIKVLPELFASDAERLSRFEREAQVLAALNHPHIAQVYGVVDAPAALVMELIEGEDLAQRIARGPIPVRESLEIARQVADALAAAHEKGIVHRDLKPANIKLRDDGTVKVLDFGLAKAVAQAAGSSPSFDPAHSPTITSPALLRQGYGEAGTQLGVILGTAAYMSPEQAKGKPVDRGADLWSFGALLFEMLTGKPAFEGETVTDVLAAIVTRDPAWNLLPPATSPSVKRLLQRCLERDRRKRLADAAEARYQLEEALVASAGEAAVPASVPARRGVWFAVPWALATLLGIAAAIFAMQSARPQKAHVARYSIDLPPKTSLVLSSRPAVAVSPDGSTVVFAGMSDGVERLYRRHASSFDATAISGTEAGSHPVISPDGRWLAFMTPTKLTKIPLGGGLAVTLADVSDPRGLSWDSDDTIIYTPTTLGGVFRIPAAGGTPVQVTTPKPGAERTHRWPQELPGGAAVIYTIGSFSNPDNYDDAVIEAQMVATGERRTLLAGAAMARYLPTGHLLFARGTTLFLVPFDARKVEVTGSPAAVIQGLGVDVTTGAAHVSASRSGTIAYISAGTDASALRLTEVDQSGRAQPLDLPAGNYSEPAVSPDGQQLAVSVIAGGGRDIWVHHRQRKTFTRLTFEGQNLSPVWSRDGSMIYYVFIAATEQGAEIHRRPSDGSREAEHIASMSERGYLSYLTRDERSAVIELVTAGAARSDIHQIALAKDAKSVPLLATRFNEYAARLSPDGRWMAYVSNESGRQQIYVRPAPGGGGRWQVSTDGGEEPKWSPDGRQLYYRSGNLLMAVTVGAGTAFEGSPARQLISGIYNLRNESGLSYDVDPKTGRFVMIRPGDDAAEGHSLRTVVNWFQEIREGTAK